MSTKGQFFCESIEKGTLTTKCNKEIMFEVEDYLQEKECPKCKQKWLAIVDAKQKNGKTEFFLTVKRPTDSVGKKIGASYEPLGKNDTKDK